jgi:hypothetical protein
MTGIPRFTLGPILRPIQRYCEHQKIPLLNVLAVSQESGLPGDGFHGNFKDVVTIFQEQAKVYAHDWFKDAPPKPEDLEKVDH